MMPALPEVSIPRFTGTAEYASRVRFPDMLHARFLTSPHPRARLAARAALSDVEVTLEVIPGVPHVFQGFAGLLDEAGAALDRASDFLNRHFARK